MNITEETNQNLSNNTNLFSYSLPNNTNSLPWTQGSPQYIPWGHSPNSPPASLVTFSAAQQIETSDIKNIQMNRESSTSAPRQNQLYFGQNLVNNQTMACSTSNFGHNIISGNQSASTSSYGNNKPLLHCKRKANVEFPIPNKQHITEERMAQQMSRLHISSESHPETLHKDLEDSTTRQKRLYVCEEMRRLQTDNILPTALLGRLERPCMAVMLWQPPAKIPELFGSQSVTNSSISSAMAQAGNLLPRPAQSLEEDENDNSSDTLNLNNMELDS